MYKRKQMIKLQYLRPQTEVFAATCHHLMGTSFYGHAGDGDYNPDDDLITDAKKSELGFEFSFNNVWEK